MPSSESWKLNSNGHRATKAGLISTALEEYRRLVSDAVFPDLDDPVRLRDASAAIGEYSRSTGDLVGTIDLMLTFIEAGTEQSVDLGYGDDGY